MRYSILILMGYGAAAPGAAGGGWGWGKLPGILQRLFQSKTANGSTWPVAEERFLLVTLRDSHNFQQWVGNKVEASTRRSLPAAAKISTYCHSNRLAVLH